MKKPTKKKRRMRKAQCIMIQKKRLMYMWNVGHKKRYKDMFSSKTKPASPLSLELENADWPLKFKLPASLPEFDGESDPIQFL
jgi:hypothetical protein